MTLWRFEARKMFKRNRGAVIAALFLLSEFTLLLFTDAPVNADAALCREEYLAGLEQVEGPWTEEKAALLERQAQEAAGDSAGFDVLYKQYLYVNEGREDRYFLDANGWAGLLADRALDLPLTAAVILLAVPVYCGEAVSGMEPLSLTARDGRRLFLRHKIVLTLAATAALSLSADLVRLAFFALKYGLPHGGYPMQSVESLGSAGKALSLWGAEGLTAALRLLGSLELAAITLLFSALCGQYALTAFLATAAAVLPWLGLDKSAQYALPLPSSLLTAVGFVEGGAYETDAVTGERVAVFREVGWTGLALTAAGALLISAACILLIRRRYRTGLSGGGKAGRRPAALCLALVLCLTLGGCAGEGPNLDGDTIYNSRDHQSYTYNGLTVSARDGELVVTDSSGGSAPLVLDALRSVNGAVYDTNFFASGRYVYLWRADAEGYGQKLASDTGKTYITSLIRVDLDTFDAEVVFETVVQHTVLGIDVPADETLDFLGHDGDFFVDEEHIYILGSGTRQVDLRTGKVEALDIPSSRNVAFDGRYIYFVRDEMLFRYDAKAGTANVVREEPVRDFRLTDKGLSVTGSSGEEILLER